MTIDNLAIFRKIEKIEKNYSREIFRNYRQALDSIQKEISRLYEKFDDLTWAEMAKFNRYQKLQAKIAEILNPVFASSGRLIDRLQIASYTQAFYRHEWAIDNAYRVDLNWGLLPQKAIEEAVDNPLKHIAIDRLKQGGKIKLNRAITQGLIRGDSYPKMMRAIRDVVVSKNKESLVYDTMRILRTEGQRAAVKGQQAQAEESRRLGIDVVEIWDATLDGRTRPDHGAMDGKVKKEDGFHTAVGIIPGPLQSGVASFDINCRCSVREQLPDDPPVIRQIQESRKAEPYITFADWQKRKG